MSAQVETIDEAEVPEMLGSLVCFDPFETELAEFRERYDGIVYDLDDESQNKAARSDRHAIGKVIARLDRQHKAVKEPLLEATQLLDGRRKKIKDGFLEVQDRIKSQIEAHEAKEEARVSDIAKRIEDIRMQLAFDPMHPPGAAEIASVIEAVQAIAIDDSFAEWKGSALLAKTETIEALEQLLVQRQQHEAEQAELARLRAEKEERERAEREARIAAEAAQKAKEKAEREAAHARQQAELEHQHAEERAEKERVRDKLERQNALNKATRERDEANARAERAAAEERTRIEREQKEAEHQAAAEREAEDKRKAKQQHRAEIHRKAKLALMEDGLDESIAHDVVKSVADGHVPHMQIVY